MKYVVFWIYDSCVACNPKSRFSRQSAVLFSISVSPQIAMELTQQKYTHFVSWFFVSNSTTIYFRLLLQQWLYASTKKLWGTFICSVPYPARRVTKNSALNKNNTVSLSFVFNLVLTSSFSMSLGRMRKPLIASDRKPDHQNFSKNSQLLTCSHFEMFSKF